MRWRSSSSAHGGNRLPETTGKWVATTFEHDSARPVNGYAAPQLHTHAVFSISLKRRTAKREPCNPMNSYDLNSMRPRYTAQSWRSTSSLAMRSKGEKVVSRKLPLHSEYWCFEPRSHKFRPTSKAGRESAGAAQIAAHQTRDDSCRASRTRKCRECIRNGERFGISRSR